MDETDGQESERGGEGVIERWHMLRVCFTFVFPQNFISPINEIVCIHDQLSCSGAERNVSFARASRPTHLPFVGV